jgi:organic hydroperoxide reductase OsmC/OhrA
MDPGGDMHEYTAKVAWSRGEQPFTDSRYSRKHVITFDGGAELSASASPLVVRVPFSDPSGVDPEELFVASISSCHMLWFLSLAAERKFRIDSYSDAAVGIMEKDSGGRLHMSVVTLCPRVTFSGETIPGDAEFLDLHHRAHEECFIANSVRTKVTCLAEIVVAP